MAQLRFAYIFLVYSTIILKKNDAHPTGAPTTACRSLVPQHKDSIGVGGGQPPYTLKVPATVTAGSKTPVIIQGTVPFQGFIVRVTNAQGSGGPSSFVTGGPSAQYQAITCDTAADTATHTNPSNKTAVQLEWVAKTAGTYQFAATIAQDYQTYYTGYKAVVNVVAAKL